MSNMEARLACASSFILQSPPGEVNDVFNDVRALVGDDGALEAGILPALQKYNVDQLIVADLPDGQQLMICPSGSVQEVSNRFIEPSTAKAWLFDHLRLSASEPLDVQMDTDCEAIRVELEKAASSYGKEHFTEGVSKVFTSEQRTLKSIAEPKDKTAETDSVPATAEFVAETLQGSKDIESEMPEDSRLAESSHTGTDTELVDPETEAPAGEGATTDVVEDAIASGERAEVDQPDVIDTDMVANVEGTGNRAGQDTGLEDDMSARDTLQSGGNVASTPVQSSEESEPIVEDEATSTVPAEPLPKRFSLYFVGNKYNPANYWTGRWRSIYELDLSQEQPKLQGSVHINVHLFEQGNVQLATKFNPTVSLPDSLNASSPPADIAKAVMKGISKVEEDYQLELNEAYRDMADRTFRNLRRVLPVTRQKMDWADRKSVV